MGTHHIHCIGATGAERERLERHLSERTDSYVITSETSYHSPSEQFTDADCIVAIHNPPETDASDILERVRREVQSPPVVVYAVDGSEQFAAAAVNAGVSQYVRPTGDDDWQRLATAIIEVTTRGKPECEFSPTDIIEQFPTAAFVLNESHEITYWNEACAKLLEYESDEMLGTKHPFKAFYDESRPVLADLVLEGADPEQISRWYDEWYESPHLENVVIGEDFFPEQDIWLRFAAAPLTDHGGNIRGAIETLEEITQRKEHKRELERYKTIVEASGDPVYTLDEEGRFTLVNNNFVKMTGYEEKELLGEHVSKVLCEDDIRKVRRHIKTVLDSDEPEVTVEVGIITATGNRRECEIHIALLPFEDEFRGTIGVVRDITSHKEREEKLRKFQQAVTQAGHAIFIADTDGTIEYVNPAFEEVTGYPYEDAVGSTPAILKSGEQDAEFYEELWATILDGEVWEGELINERRSGERFAVHETIAPIQNADGTIQGFIGIQDEITARQLREQQLEVFHRVLRHNLRNKGTAIKGHTDLLERSLTVEEDLDHLQTIQDSVKSLIEISEKAHHVRQVVADALEETASRELRSALESIRNRVATSYPDAEVSLVYEPTQSLEIDAKATNAFHELIDNAVRHSNSETPNVEITVTMDGTVATVTISDDGPGIPEQEQHVLTSGTENQLEHSSGLGLWSAHWLIRFVGGDIDIDVDDHGTTVSVTTPVH